MSVTLLVITDRGIAEGKTAPFLTEAHQISLTGIALNVIIWDGSDYFVIARFRELGVILLSNNIVIVMLWA